MTLAGPVLLLGPPASGKGTQSVLLARKYGVPPVSLGEILRSHVHSGGAFAEEARPFLAAGVPVPVPLMSRVIRSRLSAPDMRAGFIGVGLVRTVAQAHELAAILAEFDMHLRFVFHIRVPGEEILLRARQRVWCPRCGASYSRDALASGAPGLCHADEEPLIHRADDSEKIVRHRIQTHEGSLPEIFAYYQNRGLLHEIDGARAIEAVHADIVAACAG
jgi:adenylate kinase